MRRKCGQPFLLFFGDKAPSSDRFPIAFFLHFLDITNADIMDFLREFRTRSKFPKSFGASFIVVEGWSILLEKF